MNNNTRKKKDAAVGTRERIEKQLMKAGDKKSRSLASVKEAGVGDEEAGLQRSAKDFSLFNRLQSRQVVTKRFQDRDAPGDAPGDDEETPLDSKNDEDCES
jgi:hypothetical protein